MGRWNTDETLTVKQLIEELQKQPENAFVIATWEGLHIGITPADISLKSISAFVKTPVVLIDVDQW